MHVQRLSKAFFLGSYLGGTLVTWIAGWVIWVVLWIDSDWFYYDSYYDFQEPPWSLIWPLILLIPLYIYVFIIVCVFIYRAWASIQDGHVRTGPCRALGFLFIPFFNLYWIFQAVWGFAVDYNRYIVRHSISTAPRLPEGLFLAYSILYVIAIIPFLNIAAAIANFVIGAILISKVCDAVNALPAHSTEAKYV